MSTDIEDKDGNAEDVATGDDAEEDDADPAERRCGISLKDHPEE